MTGDESIRSPKNELRRRQFGLRGMFVLLFSAAIGLSAQLPERKRPFDCLLVAAVVWMVLGLANQIRDLWTACRRKDRGPEERWAFRFAILWRSAVAAILAGSCLLEGFLARQLLTLPERPDDFTPTGAWLRQAMFCLALVVVLGSVPRRPNTRPTSSGAPLLTVLAWPAAAFLCLVHWADQTLLAFLVYVAVSGIEQSAPLHLGWEGADLDVTARAHRFLAWTLVAAGIAAANLVAARRAPYWRCHASRRRWILGGLFGLGLGASAWYGVWAATAGVRAFSPPMAEAMTLGPLYRWFLALGIVVVLATVLAYRDVRRAAAPIPKAMVNWRRVDGGYYHEYAAVLGILLLAIAGRAGFSVYHEYAAFAPVGFRSVDWLLIFGTPSLYLQAATLLAALGGLWAVWHPPADAAATALVPLPPGVFIATWLAVFLALLVGLPALVALCFALWLSPWFLI